MSEVKKEETVEIEEKPTLQVVSPTLEDLSNEGFGAQELKEAEELGMVSEKKPEEKKTEEKKDPEIKPEEKKAADPEKPTPQQYQEAWQRAQVEDDPEKEKAKTKDFNLNEKQLYKAQKLERSKRQTAEAERDAVAARLKSAEEKAKALEAKIAEVAPELDKDGNPIKKEPAKEVAPTEEEQKAQATIVARRLNEYEEDARGRYQDFDDVMSMTADILKSPETIFKDNPLAFSKARTKYMQFLQLVGQPARQGEFNAADVAYEIGQLHPNYGKAAASTDKNEAKKETLDPKKIEKIKENSTRRSSASLPSGSGAKRVVTYDELTPEDVADWTPERFANLPEHVQERLLRA